MKKRMPDDVYEFFKETGSKGGSSKSAEKVAASKANIKKALVALRKKREAK